MEEEEEEEEGKGEGESEQRDSEKQPDSLQKWNRELNILVGRG